MGIPINGKNLFPSNIQGLPTWYIIRLSKDGYLARREMTDVQVCMNGRTVTEDMAQVIPGGIILYDDSLPIANHRKDVTYFPMPVKDLVKAANLPHALRDYVANMVYVGALTELLGIDAAEIEAALRHHFDGKEKPVQLNMDMVKRAIDWASLNVQPRDRYRVERMSGFNEGKILVDGNTAGCVGRFGRWTVARLLVSDHTFFQPGGIDRKVCRPVAGGPRNGQVHSCRHSGRRRIGGDRHGCRRGLVRRPVR